MSWRLYWGWWLDLLPSSLKCLLAGDFSSSPRGSAWATHSIAVGFSRADPLRMCHQGDSQISSLRSDICCFHIGHPDSCEKGLLPLCAVLPRVERVTQRCDCLEAETTQRPPRRLATTGLWCLFSWMRLPCKFHIVFSYHVLCYPRKRIWGVFSISWNSLCRTGVIFPWLL